MGQTKEVSILDGVKRVEVKDADRISSYAVLKKYIETWADGTGHQFLVVLGRPGILKSSMVRSALTGQGHLWIDGDTGPLALYRDIFLNNNRPTVLDDLALTKRTQTLLMNFTDNYDVRTLRWAAARALKVTMDPDPSIVLDDDEDNDQEEDDEAGSVTITLPTSFKTSSSVLWITNDISKLKGMTGLNDRGYLVEFDPPVAEVLEHAKDFLHPTVLDWAYQHARLLPGISVRDLKHAGTNLRIGQPWERILRNRYLNPDSALGAYLTVRDDPKLTTNDERIARFSELCGQADAQYYRVQAEYRKVFPERKLPRGKSSKR